MLTYFVQVNVCWLLFYGAYFALLSRETFFRLNRYWLIISLLGGLLLPWIAPKLEVVEPTNMAAVMLQPFVVSAEDLSQNLQNTEGSFFKILAAIYGLGVAVTLGKLLWGFWKIKRLLNRAESMPMDDFTLMQVREAIAPFSFFQWVFINLNLVEHADLQQIILHERAHVRERHSIDVVFAELLGVVFWWSPLVYFYTKSLKNVHEYAADAAVLRTSSAPQYGRLLLRQQQSGMSLSLANPFFSQLKKRILMMTRNPSKRRALAKYALAVPIFLVLTLLLASPKTRVMATTEAATERAVASMKTFEKNLLTPQVVDNELITPIEITSFLNDTSITENERILTLDGKTPSSERVMSLEKVRSLDKFTMAASFKEDKGALKQVEMLGLTVVRISNKNGRTQASNSDLTFTKEMKVLVQMAEIGDTYQFIGKGKEGDKVTQYPFTYYIGEKPTNPRLDALDAQQKAQLLKISESPVVLLAGRRGGIISVEDLSRQDKLEAFQVVKGKTIPVEIVRFVMFRVPKVGGPYQSNNDGGQFSTETKRIMEMATIDDNYQFMNVKCRIKGETELFDAGSIALVVKKTVGLIVPQYQSEEGGNFTAFFAGKRGGVIGATELSKQEKLEAFQLVNGQTIPVEILSFVVARLPFTHKEDYAESKNIGDQLNSESKRLLDMAANSDMYQFREVKCRVNGETTPVNAGSLAFVVKGGTPQYSAPKDSSDPVFTIVEEQPKFIGGLDSLFRFLGRNIIYPAEARAEKVEGTVYVGFVVEKDGSITNIKLKRNLAQSRADTIQQFLPETGKTVTKIVHFQDESCANEAIRVINMLPKWKPAKHKGKIVRSAFLLPIKFKLD
jgi:BlaR1 peptidase M56/Gram-negative bacterial TonB protein C-terminal